MTDKEKEVQSEEAPVEGNQKVLNDVESLREALSEEKEKAEKYLASWQRAQADFINFKKRTEQERAENFRQANALLMSSLLPILDDLERALTNVSTKLAGFTWVEGIVLIHRKLQAILEGQGLERIETEGKDFDPNLHQAVLYENGEEGKIIEELQKGYMLHGRLLRPALVKVGKGSDKADNRCQSTAD
ncbi:nucleotide exchange factor GrpE [Dehalococcoidia bacterium]|nr:nucleotide exchange factor GrpE [Dehalococcoidia bacterium]